MKRRSSMLNLVIVMLVATSLGGCWKFLMIDFDKAVEIVRIDVQRNSQNVRALDPPSGEAGLAFVLRDRNCSPPPDVELDVAITFNDGSSLRNLVNLRDLTWPTTGQECLPIGYLRLANHRRPFDMSITRNRTPVSISVSVTRAASDSAGISLWLVYNDRLPVERMLGDRARADSGEPCTMDTAHCGNKG